MSFVQFLSSTCKLIKFSVIINFIWKTVEKELLGNAIRISIAFHSFLKFESLSDDSLEREER